MLYDLRDHNPTRPSASSLLVELHGWRAAVSLDRWWPLVTADARSRPLRHGPSADRARRSLYSSNPTPSGRWEGSRCNADQRKREAIEAAEAAEWTEYGRQAWRARRAKGHDDDRP